MFCTNCGKEAADGAAFCTHCGAALQQADAPAWQEPAQAAQAAQGAQPAAPFGAQGTQEQKPGSKLPFIIGIAAAALILLAVVLVFALRGGSGRSAGEVMTLPVGYTAIGNMMEYEATGDDETVIFGLASETVVIDGGETDHYVGSVSSLDETVLALVTGKDLELYRVADGEAVSIDDGVYEISMSLDGSTVAYCRGGDTYIETQPLYVWHDDTSDLVSRDFYGKAQLSPDGQYVLYAERYGRDAYTLFLYDRESGDKEEIFDADTEINPMAVTNGVGRIIFSTYDDATSSEILYCVEDLDETEIGRIFERYGDHGYTVHFNQDQTEMVYYDYDEDAWMHLDAAGKTTELDGEDPAFVRPQTTASISSRFYFGWGYIYGIPTFKGAVYRDRDGDKALYRMGEDFEPERLVRHVDGASLGADAKSLQYRTDSTFYRMDLTKPDAEDVVLFEGEDIVMGSYNYRNRTLYAIDEDGALWYANNGSEPLKLTGRHGMDTDTYYSTSGYTYSWGYLTEPDMLLWIEDGVLYTSTAGAEAVEITDVDGEVYYVDGYLEMGMFIYTHLRSTDACYVTTDGVTYTLITDDAPYYEPTF